MGATITTHSAIIYYATRGLKAARIDIATQPEQQPEQQQSTPPWMAAEASLPGWMRGGPDLFASEMRVGSKGLTDKVDRKHLFQFAYHPNLVRMILHKLASSTAQPKIRMLEFGLGCTPDGGMIQHTPGGSSLGWRHLFNQVPGLDFELHVFEFDKECALKWQKDNEGVADGVYTGDASSEEDLDRAYEEAGGVPFDIVIDDASHINWHQIKTLDHMLPKVAEEGLYFVEDIISSCYGWSANMGTHEGENVGGTADCMTTTDGKATILSHIVEHQKHLVGMLDGFKGVTRIEVHPAMAVLSKEVMKE